MLKNKTSKINIFFCFLSISSDMYHVVFLTDVFNYLTFLPFNRHKNLRSKSD